MKITKIVKRGKRNMGEEVSEEEMIEKVSTDFGIRHIKTIRTVELNRLCGKN